jgi:hypothetical protein
VFRNLDWHHLSASSSMCCLSASVAGASIG